MNDPRIMSGVVLPLSLWLASLAGCATMRSAPLASSHSLRQNSQVETQHATRQEMANQQGFPGGTQVAVAEERSSISSPAASRTGPTITGSRLRLRPCQTATERALELTEQLALAEEATKRSDLRVQDLERTIAEKDLALQNARSEIQATRDLLAEGSSDLEKVRQEMQSLREKLRAADQQQLATLEATVALLQKALGDNKSSPKQSGKTE